MSKFPKIDYACPKKDEIDNHIKNGICDICETEVIDLMNYSESERRDILEKSEGPVCVKYNFPARKFIAGALITSTATMGALIPAAAQDNDVDPNSYDEELMIIVGSVRKPGEALYIDPEKEKHLSEIPVITDEYDDQDEALLQFALSGSEAFDKASEDMVELETNSRSDHQDKE